MDYHIIDIILTIILILSLVNGYKRGFINQAIVLLALIIGIFMSIKYSVHISNLLVKYFKFSHGVILNSLTFLIVFIAVIYISITVGNLIEKLLQFILLNWLNRIFGSILSLLITTIIMSLVLLVFNGANNQFQIISNSTLDQSKLYHPIKNIIPQYYPTAIKWYDDYINPKLQNEII